MLQLICMHTHAQAESWSNITIVKYEHTWTNRQGGYLCCRAFVFSSWVQVAAGSRPPSPALTTEGNSWSDAGPWHYSEWSVGWSKPGLSPSVVKCVTFKTVLTTVAVISSSHSLVMDVMIFCIDLNQQIE